MVLMITAGVVGILLNLIFRNSEIVPLIQDVIGVVVLVFGALNAAVAIFKLEPVTLGLFLGSFIIILLILLLHGARTFLGFFKGFRHLGVNIEPMEYILLAYVWYVFLRIIWIKSLFFYWVFYQTGWNYSMDFLNPMTQLIEMIFDIRLIRMM